MWSLVIGSAIRNRSKVAAISVGYCRVYHLFKTYACGEEPLGRNDERMMMMDEDYLIQRLYTGLLEVCSHLLIR